MALGFDESKLKYRDYIRAAIDLRQNLEEMGFTVHVQDDIELGATYFVMLDGDKVARIDWNAPHYLTFESYVEQKEKSFVEDYVRNLHDWERFLNDVQTSLKDFRFRHRVAGD